ncbi:MAG: putative lipid II flippase MurJ [Chloroflexota bacterium]|nr:murein biosynthesis integral membrane protein MurJ [Chloroflexota bacterium]NOG62754.1 murein biosynthesis integral membrane protein MurJ [Chloroflexota bacterium]GIK63038.1 MAG: putative lipid II flippase MurJ [Chloroflexota bacterium]
MGLKQEAMTPIAENVLDGNSTTASVNLPTSDTSHETSSVARATGLIALGNISSRVLGLAREMILSYLFGAGTAVDAFKIAIIVPRSLYDLLIGGHVNSALVPVLSDYAGRENRRELWELVNLLLGLVTVALLIMILGLEILAPLIIRLVGGEASDQTIRTATDLLRVTAPALLFLSLFAVVSGMLYGLKRFRLPAFAATVFNGTIVASTIIFERQLGITAAAVGWLIGAVVQLAIQYPDLRDAPLRPKLRGALSHPGVRTIGLLYIPVLASLGLDVLINRPFSYNLASRTGEGNISYMDWATTLIQFPHGLVATAISIAVLPTLSQQAARAINEGLDAFKNTLGFGLRLAITLILPATFGLFVLATPVVALLFQHGAFTASDTDATSLALRLYLIGLPFAAIDLLLVFAFYAQQDTLTPALIGLVSLIAYMVTALLLLDHYSFYSLMIADSVKHMVHTSISWWLLRRRIKGLHGQHLFRTTSRALVAAGIMALCSFVVFWGMEKIIGSGTVIHELLLVVGPGTVGILVFIAVGYLGGLQELRWFMQFAGRRLKRIQAG